MRLWVHHKPQFPMGSLHLYRATPIGIIQNVKQNNKNQKPFEKIIIMEYDLVGIGTIKMTVGVRRRTREKVQYCITAITNQL